MFLGVAVSVLNLDKFGMSSNLAVDVGVNLYLLAGRIKALCGIRATGKYFPLARHCRAFRVDVRAPPEWVPEKPSCLQQDA